MSLRKLPSYTLLMGFEAAARLGHFSRAAEELCLSQSAISHQIQQLEAQLGQPLFHRVGRGVELTVAGSVLLKTVQQSLGTLQNGLARIRTYLEPGLVAIVCPPSLAQGWLSAQLDGYQAQHAEFLPVLSVDTSARFVDELDVDIYIGEQPLQQADLHEQILLRDHWQVWISTTLAQRMHTQPEHLPALLCLEQSLADDAIANFITQNLAAYRKRAIYDDERLVLDALVRGQGIACLPQSLLSQALRMGLVQAFNSAQYAPLPGKICWIARAAGATRDPLVLGLYTYLCQAAQEFGV